MNEQLYDSLTRLVQSMLQPNLDNGRVTLPDGSKHVLTVDGKFGAFTAAAYSQADAASKQAIDNVLAINGTTEVGLATFRSQQKATVSVLPQGDAANGLKRYYDWPSIQAAISRWTDTLGTDPVVRSVLMLPTFTQIEAMRSKQPGLYDSWHVAFTSPYAMGLYSFIPATWNSLALNKSLSLIPVSTAASGPNLRPEIGNPLDMNANVRALIALTSESASILSTHTPPLPVNVDTLYAMHQQGSVSRLTGKLGASALENQSGASLILVARAAKAVGNTALASQATQIALAKGANPLSFA